MACDRLDCSASYRGLSIFRIRTRGTVTYSAAAHVRRNSDLVTVSFLVRSFDGIFKLCSERRSAVTISDWELVDY